MKENEECEEELGIGRGFVYIWEDLIMKGEEKGYWWGGEDGICGFKV